MTENKQDNPEASDRRHWWACKKINPVKNFISNGVNRDTLKWIIIGLAGFVIIVLIFGAGMFVGGMKAKFSYRWAESYHKNFAGPRAGFFGDWRGFPRGDFIEGHGTFGEIIKINPSTSSGQVFDLVIKGQGDVEKIVLISEKATIEKGRETIKKEELKVGDRLVVIGSPNEQGQIEAKLIRLFDGEKTGIPGKF